MPSIWSSACVAFHHGIFVILAGLVGYVACRGIQRVGATILSLEASVPTSRFLQLCLSLLATGALGQFVHRVLNGDSHSFADLAIVICMVASTIYPIWLGLDARYRRELWIVLVWTTLAASALFISAQQNRISPANLDWQSGYLGILAFSCALLIRFPVPLRPPRRAKSRRKRTLSPGYSDPGSERIDVSSIEFDPEIVDHSPRD